MHLKRFAELFRSGGLIVSATKRAIQVTERLEKIFHALKLLIFSHDMPDLYR